MCRVTGVRQGTRHSHHLVRVSVEQLLVEQFVKIGWKHLSFVVSLIQLSLRVTAVSV